MTNKYIDVNECCDGSDIDDTTNERGLKQKIKVILNNVSLERVDSTKFLGVIIVENLTWKKHIDVISKMISRNIGMLTKMKHYVPGYIILIILYSSLTLYKLRYFNLWKYM